MRRVILIMATAKLFLHHDKQNTYTVDSEFFHDGLKYSIEERISSGGNGVVHKCVRGATGDEYAVTCSPETSLNLG